MPPQDLVPYTQRVVRVMGVVALGLAIGSTGRRITMENQAKKRKGGAEKWRQKDITFTRQGFTNEKEAMFIFKKLKKLFCAQIKAQHFCLRALRAGIKCGSTYLSL